MAAMIALTRWADPVGARVEAASAWVSAVPRAKRAGAMKSARWWERRVCAAHSSLTSTRNAPDATDTSR